MDINSFFNVFSTTPADRAEAERRNWAEHRRRCASARDWDWKTRFTPEMNLTAVSWDAKPLFPGVPTTGCGNPAKSLDYLDSPCGQFRYTNAVLTPPHKLRVGWGLMRGTVVWDGPVTIPRLHQRDEVGRWGAGDFRNYECHPWMSITPSEIITQRSGVRHAKGHVVVGGLGLGWLLERVEERKKVECITLVEVNQGLVDWLLPVLRARMGDTPIKVIVGDVDEVVPKLTADVCLLDVYPYYGSNGQHRDKLDRESPNVKHFWAWGGHKER